MSESPVATLNLVDRRIKQLEARLHDATEKDRERTRIYLGTVKARSEQLRGSVDLTDPDHTLEVGQALLRIIDTLESDVQFVAAPDAYARLDHLERQLRGWMGAIDDLQVQATLGRMELRDDVKALLGRGRGTWKAATHGLAVVGDDSRAVVHDVEQVVHDLRETAHAIVRGPVKS